MPQFKIAKTDEKTKLANNTITEDKLYIYKETNTFGHIFYDFDDGTRIKIGSLNNVYKINNKILTEESGYIEIKDLSKYESLTFAAEDINNVQINSLVISNQSIYNIRQIDRLTGRILLRKLYTQKDLQWNDYYE